VLTYWLLGTRADVAAAVADSGAPSRGDINDAAKVHAAVLLLASPIDRETAIAPVQEYEGALRAAGKAVEAHYYPDGSHVVTLSEPTAADASQRALDFFHRYLH
jgi:dienelactone hydrolase